MNNYEEITLSDVRFDLLKRKDEKIKKYKTQLRKNLVTIFSITHNWKLLTSMLVATLILELFALLLLSDIINLVLKQNPILRLNELLQIQLNENYKFHIYFSLLIFTYITIALLQSKYLTLVTQVGFNISSDLYTTLKATPYEVFATIQQPKFQSLLVPETQRAASAVITPAFNLVAKLLLVLAIFVVLFVELGFIVTAGLLILLPYIVLMFLISNFLRQNGVKFSVHQVERQDVIKKTFDANKVLYTNNIYNRLEQELLDANRKLGEILGINTILSQIPKYAIELLIGISFLLLYYFINYNENNFKTFEDESLVLVAALKLIPSFQQIYRSYSQIIANYSSLDNILAEKYAIIRHANNIKRVTPTNNIHHRSQGKSGFISAELKINQKAIGVNSLQYSESDVILIRGKSGVGKTSFIENLIGLREDVEIESIISSPPKRLFIGPKETVVSYCPQEKYYDVQQIFEFLSNGSLFAKYVIHELAPAWEISDILKRILKDRETGELSGGQKRKLAIIFSLISDCSYIFLDEPGNDMDKKSKLVLLELISYLQTRSKTIFIISHDDEIMADHWKILWLKEKS